MFLYKIKSCHIRFLSGLFPNIILAREDNLLPLDICLVDNLISPVSFKHKILLLIECLFIPMVVTIYVKIQLAKTPQLSICWLACQSAHLINVSIHLKCVTIIWLVTEKWLLTICYLICNYPPYDENTQ